MKGEMDYKEAQETIRGDKMLVLIVVLLPQMYISKYIKCVIYCTLIITNKIF